MSHQEGTTKNTVLHKTAKMELSVFAPELFNCKFDIGVDCYFHCHRGVKVGKIQTSSYNQRNILYQPPPPPLQKKGNDQKTPQKVGKPS